MKKINQNIQPLLIGLLYVLFAGHPVLADDTEVLIGPGGQAWAKPNVLFIMDTSGSMGWDVDGNNPPEDGPSRLSIVQDVFERLMESNSGFNVGLMRFDSSGNGGYFVRPMQELGTGDVRDDIIDASNALSATGNTPLSETLYEAARFWGGLSVDYGSSENVGGVSENGAYISPITSQCQRNFTILLTDGMPDTDTGADNNIRDEFLGGTACSGNCLDEVAGYMNTADQQPGAAIPGTQIVDTFTIGFTTDQALLLATGLAGGGTPTVDTDGVLDGGNDHYITTSNAMELSDAFAGILGTITDTNDSFSPPALAANAFNGIAHFNRLYFTLFEPAAAPKWNGNVKPYALNDDFELIDADDENVVNASGFFLETSRSFWASADDGSSITAGGANSRLPAAADRKLYTYTGDYDLAGLVPDSRALSNASNALENSASSSLTPAMLGLTGTDPVLTTEFNDILATIRGSTIGAPLHSQPALVTYGGDDADSADLTLFVATNDGFLHALNASPSDEGSAAGGQEIFAFIPKELLTQLPTLARGTGDHPYGLDGDISVWVKESADDTDHTIEADEGDHVYVYVGMRRGGNNYYALDVTNRDAPTLKWVIRGGTGGTDGFAELGQSWSKPTLTTINYGPDSGTRKVLIFAGGYDIDQDANPLNTDDDSGRAIFIVDADTGERLWWAGPSGSGADLEVDTLTNSIPSDVRIIDSNLDGNTDRIYVGDMRGQIFRFDLQATATAMSGSAIRLAHLGGSVEADNRRFYYAPDIVYTERRGTAPYLSVNIGSGYRAHPLNPTNTAGAALPRVSDRFYSLRDPNVLGAAPSDFPAITHTGSTLFDATSSLVTSEADTTALNAATGGWYITLGGSGTSNGEKVLATSMTINNEIFFTTYTPPDSVSSSECAPPPGLGRLYRISLFDASPVRTGAEVLDPDAPAPTVDDRAASVERPGIPTAPTAMFRQNGDGDVEIINCVGTECNALPNAIQMQESYWQDN